MLVRCEAGSVAEEPSDAVPLHVHVDWRNKRTGQGGSFIVGANDTGQTSPSAKRTVVERG